MKIQADQRDTYCIYQLDWLSERLPLKQTRALLVADEETTGILADACHRAQRGKLPVDGDLFKAFLKAGAKRHDCVTPDNHVVPAVSVYDAQYNRLISAEYFRKNVMTGKANMRGIKALTETYKAAPQPKLADLRPV